MDHTSHLTGSCVTIFNGKQNFTSCRYIMQSIITRLTPEQASRTES